MNDLLQLGLQSGYDRGDDTLPVVDTRSVLDVNAVPYAIPGATWIAAEDIDDSVNCRAIARSSCTAPDPTRRRAPGWRSS